MGQIGIPSLGNGGIMKKIVLLLLTFLGSAPLFAGSTYDVKLNTITMTSTERLVGQFNLERSSTDATLKVKISSNGLSLYTADFKMASDTNTTSMVFWVSTRGFVQVNSSMSVQGLFSGSSGTFSSWVLFGASASVTADLNVTGLLLGTSAQFRSWATFIGSIAVTGDSEFNGLIKGTTAQFSSWTIFRGTNAFIGSISTFTTIGFTSGTATDFTVSRSTVGSQKITGPLIFGDGTVQTTAASGSAGSSVSGSSVARAYDFYIGTFTGAGYDFVGLDKTPFVFAIASGSVRASTYSRVSVFVGPGTYTVRDVKSWNFNWTFSPGATLRRCENGVMFEIYNGKFEGGVVIATADASIGISTPAFIWHDNTYWKDTVFQNAQTNSRDDTLPGSSTTSFVHVATASNVVWENIDLSSVTNMWNDSASRTKIISINLSTVTIRNCKFNCYYNSTVGTLFNSCVAVFHSNVDISGSYFATNGGIGLSFWDKTGVTTYPQTKYRVNGNTFEDFSGGVSNSGVFVDSSYSSGSIISNNFFYFNKASGGGIFIQGGAYNNLAWAPQMTKIINNNFFSRDGSVLSGTIAIVIDADAAKAISNSFVAHNDSMGIATLISERAPTNNIGYRGNRKDGIAITDQN